MYTLKNASGNVFRRTASEHKRDQLLALGYVEVTEEKKAPKAPKAPKNGQEKEGK